MNKCVVCGAPGTKYVMFYCDRTVGGPWCGDHFEKATGCTEKNHGEGCVTAVFETADEQ